VAGGVYTNKYFEFTIAIPKDWQVQDNETQKELMNQGENLISGDDKNLKAMIDASELNTLNLISIFHYPVGAAVESNPSFISIAEKVEHYPGIKTGKDYLLNAKKF